MLIVHACCCGAQVRQDSVIACCLLPSGKEVRTFTSSASGLRELASWLEHAQVPVVAAGGSEALLTDLGAALEPQGVRLVRVDVAEVRSLPGRPVDTLDAEWFAQLLAHGLLDESAVLDRRRRRTTRLLGGIVALQLALVAWSLATGARAVSTEGGGSGARVAQVPAAPAPGPTIPGPTIPAPTVPAPVVPAPPVPAPAPPKRSEHPEFNRLMTHDVVLGLLAMEKDGRASLALTRVQKECLQAIAPEVVAWMRQDRRKPSPLDTELRKCLSEAQLTFISDGFNTLKAPRDLGPSAEAFSKLVQP